MKLKMKSFIPRSYVLIAATFYPLAVVLYLGIAQLAHPSVRSDFWPTTESSDISDHSFAAGSTNSNDSVTIEAHRTTAAAN